MKPKCKHPKRGTFERRLAAARSCPVCIDAAIEHWQRTNPATYHAFAQGLRAGVEYARQVQR